MHAPVSRIFQISAAALGAAAFLLGCAQASRDADVSQRVASPGLYRLASSSVRTTVYESRTMSFALDRIDQHYLPLDQTYRHSGTGRGVTVYVFDGGILGSHPELDGRVRARTHVGIRVGACRQQQFRVELAKAFKRPQRVQAAKRIGRHRRQFFER